LSRGGCPTSAMTDLRTRPELNQTPSITTPRRRTLSAAQVMLVGLVLYTVATLLNASWLQRWANNLPIGTQRTAAIHGSNAARRVSHAIWLDRPGNVIDRLRHQPTMPVQVPVVPAAPRRAEAPVVAAAPSSAPSTTVSVATTVLPPSAGSVPTVVVAPPDRSDAAAPTTAVPTTTTVARPPSVAGLSFWYGGDSLAQGIGEALQRLGTHTDRTTVTGKGIVSSGLSRPDVLDWSNEVAAVRAAGRTDVMVMMLGANDTADIVTPSGVAAFGDPAWIDEYRLRIAAVMAQVDTGTIRLLWLGLPAVRSNALEEKLKRIDTIIRAEAKLHKNVTYVDLHRLFSNEDGSYRPYCDGFDGGQVLCRSNDGVHFNDAGYGMVANVVMQAAAR
jgi:uncharacterized protein